MSMDELAAAALPRFGLSPAATAEADYDLEHAVVETIERGCDPRELADGRLGLVARHGPREA